MIEANCFRTRDSDGMWHGKAMRRGTHVDVVVDGQGYVTTR
jgi:hypothetical protein